jgi:twitching motility protein PilT
MRDLETIRLALTAAETGHLVFGTLHTSSAAKTIDCVVDVFPPPRRDGARDAVGVAGRRDLADAVQAERRLGRVAAHEIMIASSAIKNLIRENKIAQMYSSIQTGQSAGMQTLDQNLTDLVRRNVRRRGARQGKVLKTSRLIAALAVKKLLIAWRAPSREPRNAGLGYFSTSSSNARKRRRAGALGRAAGN